MNIKTTIAVVALSALSVFFYYRASDNSDEVIVSQEVITNKIIEEVSVDETSGHLSIPRTVDSSKSTRFMMADSPARIKAKDGTVLKFPADVFVDAQGNPVSGKIRLEIEEYYDLSSMIKARLSTGSGSQLLETAGMVNIQAFAGGKPVYIRQDKTYEIAFPRRNDTAPGFQLFYGEWTSDGIIDWQLAVTEQTNKTPGLESTQINATADCFLQISDSKLRRGTTISNMDFFNWKLITGQTLNQWFVANFNPDLAMLNDYCANDLRTQITFHVNEKGEFLDYYISQSANLNYDRALAAFLSTMPALDLEVLMPNYTSDHACILTFSGREMKASENVLSDFTEDHAKDSTLKNVETSALDYYIFSSSKLGWINCDRFVPEDGPLVNMSIKAPGGFDALVSLIFDDTNSILNARLENDVFVIQGVPKGRNARLVGLNNQGGNTEMSMIHLVTDNGEFNLKRYKPINLDQLNLCFQAQSGLSAAIE